MNNPKGPCSLRLTILDLGFRVECLGFRVRIEGLGFGFVLGLGLTSGGLILGRGSGVRLCSQTFHFPLLISGSPVLGAIYPYSRVVTRRVLFFISQQIPSKPLCACLLGPLRPLMQNNGSNRNRRNSVQKYRESKVIARVCIVLPA